MRLAPSASAAMPEIATSTGLPAFSAACRVGVPSVSTATIFFTDPIAAAQPAIRPPPPTAISSVSNSACSANSSATLPAPANTTSSS